MIFDCHFRHAIVINRLSIQINRHLSTPIDCQRHPAIRPFDYFLNRLHNVVRPFDYFLNRLPNVVRPFDHFLNRLPNVIRPFDYFLNRLHNVVRPFDYSLNRLPTSSDHSIISSIDCPGFTPWAGVCRTFGAGWGWCLFLLAVFFNNLFFLLSPIYIQSFGFQIIFM